MNAFGKVGPVTTRWINICLLLLAGAAAAVLLPAWAQDETEPGWVDTVEKSLGTIIGNLDKRRIGPDGSQAQDDGDDGDGGTGPPGGAALADADPSQLDPDDAAIAPLITTWLGSAQPLESANGGQLRFDEWGRVVGTTATGDKIFATRKPTNTGGQSSTGYVWGRRQYMASTNLCMLEDYVMAMLGGGDLADCRIEVPALASLPLPDLVGQNWFSALQRLKERGFEVEPKFRKAAPTPGENEHVYAMSPAPGKRAAAGSTVKLTIYAQFKGRIKMPNMIGMKLGQALVKIGDLGMSGMGREGIEPTSPDQDGIVYEQNVAPGKSTRQSEGIIVTYYHVKPQFVMPELRGLTFDDASTRMREFKVWVRGGGTFDRPAAPTDDAVGRVAEQSIAAGELFKEGAELTLRLFGASKAQLAAKHDCSYYRGTVSYWDQERGAPACHCTGGFTWSEQNRRCVGTPEQQVAALDCDRFPGAQAQWDETSGGAVCGCQQGLVAAPDRKSCVRPPPTVQPKQTVKVTPPVTVRSSREKCVLRSGYGGLNLADPLMVLVRFRNARPDGLREYRFAVANRDVPVYMQRARADMSKWAGRDGGDIVVDGTKRQFCAYLERNCAQLVGVGGMHDYCGYAPEDPRQADATAEANRRAEQDRRARAAAEQEARERQRRQEQARLEQERRDQARRQAALAQQCPDLYRKIMILDQRGNSFESLMASNEASDLGCDYMEMQRVLGPYNMAAARGQQKQFDVDRHLRSLGMTPSGGGPVGGPGATPGGLRPASEIPYGWEDLSCREIELQGYECPSGPWDGDNCILGMCPE